MSIATELTALSGHITNAYNAVNTKGGTIPANKNMANLDDAILSIPSGGQITNGIIEQYKAAASTISADTFVEFVNNAMNGMTLGSGTVVTGGANDTYTSATLLEQDKVFVTSSSSGQLYASICTISGNTVTRESLVQLSTDSSSGDFAQAVALTPTSVFVAYRNGSVVYAMVCTISGTTITPGTGVRVHSDYRRLSIAKLSETAVFMVSGIDPTAVVCTVSGTTITPGTETTLDSNGYYIISDLTASKYPLVAVSSNLVFVAYLKAAGNTYESLNAMACSVAGDAITPGNSVVVTTNTVGAIMAACALSSDAVFLAYRDITNSAIYGTVGTISDTSLLFTAPTSAISYNGSPFAVVPLDSSLVCIFHEASGPRAVTACTISDGAITGGTSTSLASSYFTIAPVALSPTKVFFSAVGGTFTRGFVAYSDISVQPSQTKIDGLTADDITTSTAGDVWVLNTES